MSDVTIHLGDCLQVMPTLPANSVHSIVCDPPYGLSFMGKHWDHGVPGVAFWEAALRVAKPGAMMLAFGGTRTFHRLTVAIEDAGWEIRDVLSWNYGSGFPKSHDIAKAIDKHLGAEREVIGTKLGRPGMAKDGSNQRNGFDNAFGGMASGPMSTDITAPATDAARQWDGWGTALKPAWEPIILAMKPVEKGFANNALVHGVAGLNVDGCRIGTNDDLNGGRYRGEKKGTDGSVYGNGINLHSDNGYVQPQGRWPSNLLLDDEAAALLDEMSGERKSGDGKPIHAGDFGKNGVYGKAAGAITRSYADQGGASRYFLRVAPDADEPLRMFYCGKASKRDRDEGLEGMPERESYRHNSDGRYMTNPNNALGAGARARAERGETSVMPRKNGHPCVKPTQLMRYLVRLVTPPNGTVLDPFMGSGSTGKAAKLEGFDFVGIEIDAEYLEIARRRIDAALPHPEGSRQAQLPLLECHQ